MKKLIDFILAIALIVILLPMMLIVALLVRWRIGSHVLFVQRRPGLDGKPFSIYKFRTMSDIRDEKGDLLPDGERMTMFGKFLRSTSMDELPELINVLKGDMSFVGPRPLLIEYLSYYSPEQAKRHAVRPGITGWAQVNGRNLTTWDERFRYDLWYVKNRTIWLDFKILWLTLIQVFKRSGINADGHITMPKFNDVLMGTKNGNS